jgi:CspA family cold shock protein
MERGKIKTVDRPQGFGFIETDDGDKVFFHQRWLRKIKFRDLNEGDEVVFEIGRGPRGMRAFNLELLTETAELAPTHQDNSIFKD